ncbi:hypothetical protein DFH06DRAFT_1131119 [Mycena polygramma]|nr:hypothetical protein DFH06DRAFT_1131119 [Mycena polygramma]
MLYSHGVLQGFYFFFFWAHKHLTSTLELGDAGEPVRVRVQQIIQEIPKVYAYSRLFQILLEQGLKSKVAKTRQGALDEMGGVLQKSGNGCLRTFQSVPDHNWDDLGQRFAGEKVWTLVGPLPAKDKTQLEERLRRVPGPSNSETSAPPAQVFNGQSRPSRTLGPGAFHVLPVDTPTARLGAELKQTKSRREVGREVLVKVGRSEGRRTNLRRRLLYTKDDGRDEYGRGRERGEGEYESED